MGLGTKCWARGAGLIGVRLRGCAAMQNVGVSAAPHRSRVGTRLCSVSAFGVQFWLLLLPSRVRIARLKSAAGA